MKRNGASVGCVAQAALMARQPLSLRSGDCCYNMNYWYYGNLENIYVVLEQKYILSVKHKVDISYVFYSVIFIVISVVLNVRVIVVIHLSYY